jgi:hypothetical protein
MSWSPAPGPFVPTRATTLIRLTGLTRLAVHIAWHGAMPGADRTLHWAT